MAKKKVPIIYTSRDFDSIKSDLVNYAKRYYPDIYRDFNEASFGSLMLDTVSYVGDILSFYVDYQANESFLDTAAQYDNVVKLARQMGYKFGGIPSAVGQVLLYVLVPANALSLGPDSRYYPILREGTSFITTSGASYILSEDVKFGDVNTTMVAARVNESTGIPTFYALKTTGKVISGRISEETITIDEFQRFRRIQLSSTNIVEILSVTDAEGNEYYEVDNLSQNVIYKSIPNKTNSMDLAQFLRPVIVPRRFIFESDGSQFYLQFGYGSEEELTLDSVADPSNVTLQIYGRDYVTDPTLDPSKLMNTDKLGISPSNTTLVIKYRKNTALDVNASAGSLNRVGNLKIDFNTLVGLDATKLNTVRGSIEVSNEKPISGNTTIPSIEEIKQRSLATFSAQNRAVTSRDYENLCYAMPPKFGSIYRCNILVDDDSFKRNLNLYVLSQGSSNKLDLASTQIKENLKIWLGGQKMINDSIDILDGKIVNLGIKFEILSDPSFGKTDVLGSCKAALKEKFESPLQMGEPLYLTDIYYLLNGLRGVIDTKTVSLVNKTGGVYSDVFYSVGTNMSPDGRYLYCPKNVAFEIKYPGEDIRGVIK